MLRFLMDENGQGMVEYGLILGLIAIAAITALIALGPKISNIFMKSNNAVQNAESNIGTTT